VTNPKNGKVVPLRPAHEDEDEQEFTALQRRKPTSKPKLKPKPKRGLEAAAQSKRREAKPFARVPLAWAARAAIAMNCPRAFVPAEEDRALGGAFQKSLCKAPTTSARGA
jgi:hypothetical protein